MSCFIRVLIPLQQIHTRMDIGRSRRRLTEGDELRKEDFVSMNTEELEGMVGPWGESETKNEISHA